MKEQNVSNQFGITKEQIGLMIDQIIKNKYVKGCQRLNLSGCVGTWLPILKGKNWSHIKDLSLQNCNLNTECLQRFDRQKLESLQKLNIGQSKIGNQGLIILLMDLPPNLKQLWMWDCKITSLQGLNKMDLSNLTQLRLKGNNIGREGAKILALCNFTSLLGLGLKQCHIGEEGSKYLSKATFNSLQAIDMRNCNVGTYGISQIFKSSWKNIKQIGFDQKGIGFVGLLNIMKTEWEQLLNKQIYVEYYFTPYRPTGAWIKTIAQKILEQKFI